MTEISFGKMLAKLRKERNLTQQELADILNVSNKTISKWETNTTAPDIDSLKRLSQVLNVPVDVLLGNSNITTTPKSDKPKPSKKKTILLSALLLVTIFLIYYLITNFIPHTKSYPLISGDGRFIITGNLTNRNDEYYLSIVVRGISDELFNDVVITNIEYSILIDDKIVYNNGDLLSTISLTEKITLSKYLSKITINHTDKSTENLKSIIENGIVLRVKYVEENNNIDALNIPILIKK